ncbi:MAG: toprim domain-containing protein [Methanosarcinaceae archaeon]|nr:toprim domain-containing protein [Methanosarcinaceae archaeon]
MTTLDDAIAQMTEFGLMIDFPECDGRVKKARYLQEKRKSGWYMLHMHEGLVCGSYGSWKVREEGFKILRRVGSIDIDHKKLAKLREQMRIDCIRKDEQRKKRQDETAIKAAEIWQNANIDGSSEYAQRKQINTKGAKFYGKNLLVPMFNRNGEIRSIQAIQPDGNKKYMPGGEVSECFMMIEGSGPIAIVEGYATGVSINMATGYHVAVCFTASNLVKVAPFFRKKKCIICADDDFENQFNVGLKYGEQAAKELNCKMVSPIFKGERKTDFNDLHVLEGLEQVRFQCSI